MYPHPVLTPNSDDMEGSTSFLPSFDNNKLYIEKIKIQNNYIKKLIDDEHAGIYILIENNSSLYSSKHEVKNESLIVNIDPYNYPPGKYSAEILILAKNNITDYISNTFHEDFGDTIFQLDKGAIIAHLGYFSFNIKKSFHHFGEKESIFDFRNDDDEQLHGNYKIVTMKGKIIILVHTEDRIELVNRFQMKSNFLMYQIYIVPALIWALEKLATKYHDYKEEKWALAIMSAMHINDFIDTFDETEMRDSINNHTSAYIANAILHEPLLGLARDLK